MGNVSQSLEWGKPRFRKDANGIVHMDGLVSGTAGIVVFYLPAGYRPSTQNLNGLHIPTVDGSWDVTTGVPAQPLLYVLKTGDVYFGAGGSGTWASLCCSFAAT